MYVNPFQISLETLTGAAPLLGHPLEDRTEIREQQDWALVRQLQETTSVRLRDDSQRDLFSVAPLDVLVTNHGSKKFHIIEINGTGIGGLTNLCGQAVAAVLEDLVEWTRGLEEGALVLVASSGKECDHAPRLNRLLHEKLLYAEALKRGFDYSGRPAQVYALPHLVKEPGSFHGGQPAIVLGYMKDFLDHLRLESDGRLSLLGRPVHAAVNDRFCLNVVRYFEDRVDLGLLLTMNRGFLAGADKGVAYTLLNRFFERERPRCLPPQVNSTRAFERETLVQTVRDWLRRGRRAVIKPQGTGLGHGIEFFLDPTEPEAAIRERIDRSLRATEEYYRLRGGALPYTVCDHIDSAVISRSDHPLSGHKFELRVAVYRDGDFLKAFPAIVKVASEPFDPARPAPLSLINNITASAQAKKRAGAEFMLPLANRDTLAFIDLEIDELCDLCAAVTRFMRFVLDKVQDEPALFGLPATSCVPV